MVHDFRKTTVESLCERGGLKKNRCAIRMIVDGAFEGHDDVALISDEWPRKHVFKLISGLEIVNVHNEMHNY